MQPYVAHTRDKMVTMVMDWHPIQRGVVILLITSCYSNWDKLCLNGSLSSRQTFTYLQLQDLGGSLCYNLGHLTFLLPLLVQDQL